jgi:hypothetical protein
MKRWLIDQRRESGVEWYVYEQDAGKGFPFDYARSSYEFLKKNVP